MSRRRKRHSPTCETWEEYNRRRRSRGYRQAEGPVAQGSSPVTINPVTYKRLDRMLGWLEYPSCCRYDLVWMGKYLVKLNEYNEMLPVVVELVAELLQDAGTTVTFLGDQVLVR